jgi:hypothetical protein
MTIGFDAKITYSSNWSDTGREWAQVEGFLQEQDLIDYVKSMDWRIIKVEREAN